MPRHSNKFTGRVDYQQRRENAMRPSRFLGYDHDELGIYFLDREAMALAEAEFRRAVWLNPYEYMFQLHFVACLVQQKKYEEAWAPLQDIRQRWPHEAEPERIERKITEGMQGGKSPRAMTHGLPPRD